MNKAKQILTLILSLVIGGILIGYVFPIGMNAYRIISAEEEANISEEKSDGYLVSLFYNSGNMMPIQLAGRHKRLLFGTF